MMMMDTITIKFDFVVYFVLMMLEMIRVDCCCMCGNCFCNFCMGFGLCQYGWYLHYLQVYFAIKRYHFVFIYHYVITQPQPHQQPPTNFLNPIHHKSPPVFPTALPPF